MNLEKDTSQISRGTRLSATTRIKCSLNDDVLPSWNNNKFVLWRLSFVIISYWKRYTTPIKHITVSLLLDFYKDKYL